MQPQPHRTPNEKRNAYLAVWREKNRERLKQQRDTPERKAYVKAYQAARFAEFPNRMKMLTYGSRKRAAQIGVEYDEGLLEHLIKTPVTHCDCCGRELDYRLGRGIKDRMASPSLDRFDSSKGYTVENVVIICWRCNMVKRDATAEEIRALIAYMAEAR